MSASVYYVQCLSGHVMEVIPGEELEKRCKAHKDQGHLDALMLSVDECPECVDERRERERSNMRMCGDCGCPFMSFSDKEDKCAQGCIAAKSYQDIKDSPYDGQLLGLPYSGNHVDVHELV